MDGTDKAAGRDGRDSADANIQQETVDDLVDTLSTSASHDTTDGQAEVLPWHVALGPLFNRKATAAMLKAGGVVVPRWVSVQGESKRKAERAPTRLFKYDDYYVVEYLAVWLGELLEEVPRAELLKLLTRAKKCHESKQESILQVSKHRAQF